MQSQRSKGAAKPRGQTRAGKMTERVRSKTAPSLRRDVSLADAAAAIAAPAVDRAEACWDALAIDPSPDNVHKFRVAIRQLRVVLHIFRKQDVDGKLKKLRDGLKQVAAEVGRKRDIDVMIAEIVQPLSSDVDGEDVHALVDQLEQQRLAAGDDVSRALDTDTVGALRRAVGQLPGQLAKAVKAKDDDTDIEKFAYRDLRKRWRRLEAKASRLDELSASDLHEMRKMIKKLRYAFAHFAPLYDKKDGNKFTKALQRLQDAFGYLNDVAGARKTGERFKDDDAEPSLAYAAGYVLGRHVERGRDVRRRIGKGWKRLADTDLARLLASK